MECRTVNGRKGQGFTLLELLVVMAIIATLLTIAVPRYFKSLDRSKETVLRQDLAAMREQIDRSAARISNGMKQAEEDARRAGVYPGTARAIRARYSMDWPGWDR